MELPFSYKGKWYHRRQAVKELHGTLIRLLNELLPWEPKLMKAFQRNRSRLKKDYDDFKRQPDHDKFTRELWTNEEGEGDPGKESPRVEIIKSLESADPLDILEREHLDSDDMKLSEIDFLMGKNRLLKKELPSKDVQKTLPKALKRQSKQNSFLDDSTKELSPRKKAKLSTNEIAVENLEGGMQADCCLNESRQTEPPSPETFAPVDSTTSASTFLKGTKPIQALLAKNIGNKVTLTNQLPTSIGRNVPALEKTVTSSTEASPIKPALTCQTSTKGPLQMVYKMPCGQCVPIDLHNSSVKIQMQPVTDPKTGEKVMQQVLILPKNFLIQHKEGKAVVAKEIQSFQQKCPEQHCSSFSQTTNVNSSLAPVLVNPNGNISAQLSNTIFNKNITTLPNVNSSRPQTLPSVTSAGNLALPVKTSQSETGKVKNIVSTTTFPRPVASPTISSTVQPLISAATLSGSTNPNGSLHNLASQPTTDSSDTKQELKTVCIRDSQSILVRTRGGNTGVVKVQTNPDQNSPNNLSPNSVFTFTPQLQAFLVPKSTTLSSSTFSPVAGATATSCLPPFAQSSVSGFVPPPSSVSIPALPSGFNQAAGKNLKLTLGQPSCSSNLGQMVDKTVPVSSSSPFMPSVSSGPLLQSTTSNSVNVINISAGNFGQTNTSIIHAPATQQQADYKTKNYPVTPPESTTTTNGDMISGTPVQKLMLVTTPSILSPCGSAAVNMVPTPTSTGVSTQKLVFINAPMSSGTSTPTIIAESLKQARPPSMSKTYVKTTEQPQIVLIPSSVGAPIKINSPTVSQIKDVKIGLNIGQAIVNTTGSAPNVPSINILQNVTPKGAEEKGSKSFILPLSTSGSSVPVSSSFMNQNVASINEPVVSTTRAVNMFSVTANASLTSLSTTSSCASIGTRPTVLVSGNETSSRIMPILANRLCTSNIGNTVAISTVKTGHLASSVLISTTQPTVSPQCLTSALQIPVTVALSPPVTASPKIINTLPHLAAVPGATHPIPLPKRQSQNFVQFQSPGISATVPSNANTNKPQTVLPSASLNAGKIISFSNFASLPNQQMPPTLVKSAHTYSCAPGASAIQTATAPSNVTSLVGGQLNEPCIQQKIVINTSTPLAPGTQIMINGTRFIVPPQGLGAGSHVLLISTNPKYGPPLALNNGQGIQPTAPDNLVQKITLAPSNSLSWQPAKHPLKSSTKIVNSLGNASTVPVVHATPQVVNTTAKVSAPTPIPTVSLTSVIKPPPSTLLAKTSLVSAVHASNPQLPSSASVFHLDTSVKKLLVSPEGAILNAINTPASKVSSLSSSLSHIVVSASRNSATVFPTFPSSGLEKPDTAAS